MTFCVKIILVLQETWKLNYKMKMILIIIISHSYVYYSHLKFPVYKQKLFSNKDLNI